MSREVNDDRFHQVRQYTIDSDRYTIEKFLKTKGLFNRAQSKGNGNIMLECPFHEDKNPSLSINTERGLYRCFSCNSYGTYLNFIHTYYLSQGSKLTLYDVAERVLSKDSIMQEELGFSSIYKTSNLKSRDFNVDDLIIRKNYNFRGSNPPISYRLIADSLKDYPIEDRVRFVSLMQSGMNPEDVRKEFLDEQI